LRDWWIATNQTWFASVLNHSLVLKNPLPQLVLPSKTLVIHLRLFRQYFNPQVKMINCMDKIYETHPFDHVYLMTDAKQSDPIILDALNGKLEELRIHDILIHPTDQFDFPRDMLAELNYVSSNPDALFLQTHSSTFGMLAQGMSGVKNAWIVSYANDNNGVDCGHIYTSEPHYQRSGPYEEYCPAYNLEYGIKDRVF
jgi:hypothetical protein